MTQKIKLSPIEPTPFKMEPAIMGVMCINICNIFKLAGWKGRTGGENSRPDHLAYILDIKYE